MSTPVEPLRLLLLADKPEWAALLRECLAPMGDGAVLISAPNWESVSRLFDDDHSAVLLTTPSLQPGPGRCSLPCVLLLEQEPLVSPLGVSDWLVRDVLDADTVRRCLRHVRERGVLENTLQRLAEQDPLTGIANRQGFQTLLAARLVENEGRGLALGHLDLDNFRHANDALGHQAGDRLILQVVSRLKSQLEVGDQLARLGSDEFALLIDTRRAPQRAEWMAERITEVMAEPYWVDGESLLIGCSLGVAHARARAGADPLMWHAHIAMQQAKSTQGCTFISSTNASTATRAAWPTWKVSCAAPCVVTNWSCTTNRAWTSTTGISSALKPWCAGATTSVACCRRVSSCPWPNKAA